MHKGPVRRAREVLLAASWKEECRDHIGNIRVGKSVSNNNLVVRFSRLRVDELFELVGFPWPLGGLAAAAIFFPPRATVMVKPAQDAITENLVLVYNPGAVPFEDPGAHPVDQT